MSKRTRKIAVEIITELQKTGIITKPMCLHDYNELHNMLNDRIYNAEKHGRRKERKRMSARWVPMGYWKCECGRYNIDGLAICTHCGAKKERKRLGYVKPPPEHDESVGFIRLTSVSDWEHYRSHREPYDVELTRDGTKVTARVWDMPEEVRGTMVLADDYDNYAVKSCMRPEILLNTYDVKILFLRGDDKKKDDVLSSYDFPTVTAARDYFEHITALIDKLNAEYKPLQSFDAEKAWKLVLEFEVAAFERSRLLANGEYGAWSKLIRKRHDEIVELKKALGIPE